jgi:hypothetical protein
MKKLILIALFFTMNHVVAQQPAVGLGQDRGGGDLLIQDPAGTEFVASKIRYLRPNILMFLKNVISDDPAFMKEFPGLLTDKDSIIEKVKNSPIKIQMDKPCYDLNGNAFDGSINPVDQTICLSAFTIGKKVTTITAFSQLLVLAAHEYTHLMGYDEQQAMHFQKAFIYQASLASPEGGYYVGAKFVEAARLASHTLKDAQLQVEVHRLPIKAYFDLTQTLQIELFPYAGYYFPLDQQIESPQVQGLRMRLLNLNLYACTQSELDPQIQMECFKKYKSIFGESKTIDANHFKIAYGDEKYKFKPTGTVMNIMADPKKFLTEIIVLQSEFDKMASTIEQQLQLYLQ